MSKFILISCVCISKLDFISAMGHFVWPFTKNMILWYLLNISILFRTMVILFQGISWILHLIVWVKLSFLTLFIVIFGLNFYKSLDINLWWFMLINSIRCGASQSTDVWMGLFSFFFCNGPFGLPITKKIMKSLSLPK